MFPGLGGMGGGVNPKQMQKMMRQLGIKSDELPAKKVIFELEDGSKLVMEEPQVTVIDMKGQKTYTVAGEAVEEKKGIPEEDIKMVMGQAEVDKKKAEAALKKNEGDIAEAILELKGE
ncbi:MAG: nascent polypeptide-associated complex protein [Candidatus Diapherotrites archaeon]|uniref:Nascent polypeptide-associated complex protein n=1 Tax=Candidatus Iainarchaeum sp. TaxID=3101447 RepID=A0A2D6M0G8_9ARCH|nr:nascent polypeptide-associated complex protein [Candidatus Diapherotrites archaeon]|tara:strand:- start:1862 stop:2215 length:354 start_codon:yes stop_codon:yes gene_type:complete